MALLCTVIGHLPTNARHQNQGMDFSVCHHCGCDLLRSTHEGAWEQVPKGYRVAWRRSTGDAAAVASRLAHAVPPPRRRDPRNARPAPHRDARGRPFTGTAAMIGMMANLGKLTAREDAPEQAAATEPGYVIRLPGKPR